MIHVIQNQKLSTVRSNWSSNPVAHELSGTSTMVLMCHPSNHENDGLFQMVIYFKYEIYGIIL